MAAPMVKTSEPGIYTRGSKYVVVYYANGRQKKESAPNLKAAIRLKKKREVAVDEGKYVEQSRVSLADFAAEWIERYHGKPGHDFSESTRRDYRRDIQFALRFFGPKKQIGQITPHEIQRFVDWLNDPKEQGKQFAVSTIKCKVAPLASLLGTAFREQVIASNPAVRVNYPGNVAKPVSLTEGDVEGEGDEVAKAMTAEQLAAFLNIVRPDHRLMFAFLVATGLRIGELSALQWRHLELDGATPRVNVLRQFYKGKVSKPKRNSQRKVPLTFAMADALRQHKAETRFSGDLDLVFGSATGGVLNQSNVFSRVLKPAAAEAGAEWAGFHTFRHTCASLMMENERSIVTISRWLGHSSPDFTLRTYVHLMDKEMGGGVDLGFTGVDISPHTITDATLEQDIATLLPPRGLSDDLKARR
jgi:integrase